MNTGSNVMKHIAISCSLVMLGACAADDASNTSNAPSSASTPSTPSTQGAATSGRNAQAPAQPPRELGDKSQRVENDLVRSVEYYDGELKRTVWLSNELLAEIGPSEDGRARVLGFDNAAEQRAEPQLGVRLWRVRAAQGIEAASRELTREALRFSVVLHESASSRSPMSALPGGVLATFAADWDRARIEAWASARGMGTPTPVVAEANIYMLATAPGLASIELANRLHESGELVSCTPNVWREASTR